MAGRKTSWCGLVPRTQRAYLASHPLALWVSVGIAFTGWLNLLFPEPAAESSTALVFPGWLLLMFNLSWAIGGSLSVIGLLRGKPRIEGIGMTLLASGLFSLFLAILALSPDRALRSAVFIVTLAIGSGLRARHLMTHAYVNLDVPTDQPGLKNR
jgi:hypothetical protein